ncbi:MAG: twin-arginine translocation signal domain-containing protein [Candidatus Zixiibacteriota bacterium]
MDRREFIGHSGIVLGVALIGLPSLAEAFEVENPETNREFRPRLQGHKRFGCARQLNDPAIALRLPPDFPVNFA